MIAGGEQGACCAGIPENTSVLADAEYQLPVVREIWAFVSVDPKDGSEGVIAVRAQDGWMPLLAADKARLKCLWPAAVRWAKHYKLHVRLARFGTREVVSDNILEAPDDLLGELWAGG